MATLSNLLPYDPGQKKTLLPIGGGSAAYATPAGGTPWWTDQQAQDPMGQATSGVWDYGQTQNLPTAVRNQSPNYLAALGQLGWGGGSTTVQSPTGRGWDTSPEFQAWLNQKGLTSKTSFSDTGQTSALFDANGQPAAGTQRTYASDPGDNAFLMAMLAAGAFAGASVLGAGAAGGGLATDATGATVAQGAAGAGYGGAGAAWSPTVGEGLAGSGLPEYAAYTGPGSAASAPLAGDATGTGILGGTDASGTALGSGINFGSSAAGASPYALTPTAGSAAGTAGAAGGSSLLSSLGGINGVGAGISLLNSGLGYLAANKAAGVQANAAQQAQAALNAQTALNQQNQAPYLAAGRQALGTIGDLMGTSGNTGAANYGSFNHQFNAADLNSNLAPNYEFQLQQGLGAVTNAGNASGFSGNTLKGINDYAQNYAAGAYQQAFSNYTANQTNIYNRLANLAGLGQTANQAQAQIGSQNTMGAGQFGTSGAAATAGGIVGGVNAITNGLNNVNAWNYLSGQPNYSAPGWVYSDKRLKTDISRIGETDKGLPLYAYRYKGTDRPQIGPMAQEVEKVAPWMVAKDASGHRMVNYTALRDI